MYREPGKAIRAGMVCVCAPHTVPRAAIPGAGPCPRDTACLHHRFEDQALRVPERVAVVCGERQLTYQELNRRANQLAHHLRTLGVGPDVLVGLCVQRSAEMVVGLLGILKAGGAYVPLDPEFPTERLAFYAEDSRMAVLLTQKDLVGRVPGDGWRTVCLDADWDALAGQPTEDPSPHAGAGHLVYLIYTSGTTGRPKGVQIEHRALGNFLSSMRGEPGLSEKDVLLAVTTLSFDIHALEVWLPLIVGARLVVVSRAVASDGLQLRQELDRSGATVLQATPATWRLLLTAGWQGSGRLKALCGGEPLTAELATQLLPRVGGLWNLYGPTETTVWSTLARVQSAGSPVPIGRPIANTWVSVLDARLNSVPVGATGELYLGGDGLARGYLNQPDLTAERFVPDPFRPGTGARLYRTGDSGRYLPDGNLEYLGRTDHQVKVRGYRIELGEVEAALGQHPAVRAAVVVVQYDAFSAALAAYLIPQPGQGLTADALRQHLRTKLPDYMVPAHFVLLDEFPLTPTGKVDRRRLPLSTAERLAPERGSVPPSTDLQRQLRDVWEDLLRVRPIGIRDNFFELGGDSLLALRLLLLIDKTFRKHLSLAVLLVNATIEQLAGVLEREHRTSTESPLVPLQPAGSRPPLFLVHGVGGIVSNLAALARALGPEQPCYGLQDPALYGQEEPLCRMEDLAARYTAEVLRVQPSGPYCLGGYSLGATIALEMAQQLRRQGHEVGLLAALDDGPSVSRDRFPATVTGLLRFLANLPRWLVEELGSKRPTPLSAEVLRKLRVWRRRLGRRDATQVDIEECLDISQYPQAQRRLMESHYRAYKEYVPQSYPGRITLFRARIQPLFGAHLPDLGWGELAGQGVEVHEIPGDHRTFVQQPHVQVLAGRVAAALRACAGSRRAAESVAGSDRSRRVGSSCRPPWGGSVARGCLSAR